MWRELHQSASDNLFELPQFWRPRARSIIWYLKNFERAPERTTRQDHPLLPAHAEFGSVAERVEADYFFEGPHGFQVRELNCSATFSSVGVVEIR